MFSDTGDEVELECQTSNLVAAFAAERRGNPHLFKHLHTQPVTLDDDPLLLLFLFLFNLR